MKLTEKKIYVLDGAFGTMLQKKNIPLTMVPEEVNITAPEVVTDIHRQYVLAGADIIYTNTFGANRYKAANGTHSVSEIIRAGVACAKAATAGTDVKIALSVGPIGKMMEPNGEMRFEDAYEMFYEMVDAGMSAGADMVVLETMTDLAEMKAAVLAAKECGAGGDRPILATMSFERGGRTFTGVSIPAMAATLEALGADAIGLNCSIGPAEMLPMARELAKLSSIPVIIKANAGLPNLNTGMYDVTAQDFAMIMREHIESGASIVGGCCGTTPEYIGYLRGMADEINEAYTAESDNKKQRNSVICSAGRAVNVDGVRIVGERINPTGKKLFKEALKNKNWNYILTQALDQVNAGASILDVNVGLPEIDEKEMMTEAIRRIQSITDVPLQIDSSDPEVLEAALRIYNGKPLVNSVNGEKRVMDTVLPLVKKYGAAVIGLTLDENGIPDTAEKRVEIAERIVNAAQKYGIDKSDIYIDCLTLTASVQQKEAMETLKAVKAVKDRLGVKTVLGVSNISFGLPGRELINTSFLTLALAYGLDLPIINPNIKAMTDAIDAFNVLNYSDIGAVEFIEKHSGDIAQKQIPTGRPESELAARQASEQQVSVQQAEYANSVEAAIVSGLSGNVKSETETLLATCEPMEIINSVLIPALDKVGDNFEKGKIFLPQLIQSAAAATAGFDAIKEFMAKNGSSDTVSRGKIILATVKGDIHDIGKNIVRVILENYGFDVIDLGKDVPIETVVSETIKNDVRLVGLSALMTTTVANMEKTIKALRESGAECKIIVGGAVLTEEYAMKIGADYYARDAKQSADIAKSVFEQKQGQKIM